MKQKNYFKIAAFTTLVVFVAIAVNATFNLKSSNLTDIALANVEALAMNESGNCGCYGPKKELSNSNIYCQCANSSCCKDEHGCD